MARTKRAEEAGAIYHMLNRANRRDTIFHKEADFEAFERVLAEALERVQLKLFAYCRLLTCTGRPGAKRQGRRSGLNSHGVSFLTRLGCIARGAEATRLIPFGLFHRRRMAGGQHAPASSTGATNRISPRSPGVGHRMTQRSGRIRLRCHAPPTVHGFRRTPKLVQRMSQA